MYTFKEGKPYEAGDCGISPVWIIKRTPKTCLVRNDVGNIWRMHIKIIGDSEVLIDSKVPEKWRGVFTYSAKYEAEGWD